MSKCWFCSTEPKPYPDVFWVFYDPSGEPRCICSACAPKLNLFIERKMRRAEVTG